MNNSDISSFHLYKDCVRSELSVYSVVKDYRMETKSGQRKQKKTKELR